MPSERTMPTMECVSLALYDSPNSPEKMLPAAIPLVIVLEIPASSKAIAKMLAALLPSSGCSIACAWESSSTCWPCEKNVLAARRIMAELMAQPTIMEKSVSMNSYFSI